jgi:hypothetical protein
MLVFANLLATDISRVTRVLKHTAVNVVQFLWFGKFGVLQIYSPLGLSS